MPPGRPVVLVGAAEDEHVVAVREALARHGIEAVVLDSLRFPERTRLSLTESPSGIALDGQPLPLPACVYLRSLYVSPMAFGANADDEMDRDWRTTMTIFREKGEMLLSLLQRWEESGVPLYNSLTAADRVRKPYQLSLLAGAGLPVPRTLWSNDPEAVRAFASEFGRVAYKPVAGGAATKELRSEDLDDRRLATLANAPVTFQELLPGEDLRVFLLDGDVISAYRILSAALDYRQNEEQVEAITLEPEVAALCRVAAARVGLRFTGMDLKRAADGSFRILELNPSPMFLGFDRLGGTDVLGRLAAALAAHCRGA
jgi:glutathione synthase/RimK-type ligase-like ATP-grasp enzyme